MMALSKEITGVNDHRVNDLKLIIVKLGLAGRRIDAKSYSTVYRAVQQLKPELTDLLQTRGYKVTGDDSNVDIPARLTPRTADDLLAAKTLLRGTSIFIEAFSRDPKGCSAYHYAAKHSRTSMLSLLLERRPVVANFRAFPDIADDCGRSLLHLVVEDEKLREFAGVLLEMNADANKKDKNGITPIYRSARAGNENTFKLLAEHKAEIDLNLKRGKKTIIHHAVKRGCFEIVQYILENCNVVKEDFKDLLKLAFLQRNPNARKIEIALMEFGFLSSVEELGDAVKFVIRRGYSKFFESMLTLGINVNHKTRIFEDCRCKYNTLLHEAARFLQKDMADLLLARGADVDSLDDLGKTPLAHAVENACWNRRNAEQSVQVVESLLKFGANTNFETEKGCSAFYLTTTYGKKDVMELLLEYGANVNSECKHAGQDFGFGSTALHWACIERFSDFAEVFLTSGSDISAVDSQNCSALDYVHKENFGHPSLAHMKATPEDMAELLREHVVKLKAADLCPKASFLNFSHSEFEHEYQQRCEREIVELKNDFIIHTSISLYAVLTATRDELVEFLGGSMFSNVIASDLLTKYPAYGEMITRKLKQGERRKNLVDEFSVILCSIFPFLPQNCIFHIIHFLNDQQLRKLVCQSKMDLTAEDLVAREAQRQKVDSGTKIHEIHTKCPLYVRRNDSIPEIDHFVIT